jgi:hypothetical protein
MKWLAAGVPYHCRHQMHNEQNPFRRTGIPFYLLCAYTSKIASTTKLG